TALNEPVFSIRGIEADDILATLAEREKKKGHDVFIVSSDKDMLQVVDAQVRIYDPIKDRETDAKGVEERLGVPPERVTEYMALVGDASDNIPGIKGIGDKTARGLLREFKSLDDLFAHADKIEKPRIRKLVSEGVEAARLSLELVEIVRDVALDYSNLTNSEPDAEALKKLLVELGFTSLIKLLPSKAKGAKTGKSPERSDKADTSKSPIIAGTTQTVETTETLKIEAQYSCLLDMDELKAEVAHIKDSVGLDTETTGIDPMSAHLVGFSLSAGKNSALYVPLMHSYLGVPKQIEKRAALEALAPVLGDDEEVLQPDPWAGEKRGVSGEEERISQAPGSLRALSFGGLGQQDLGAGGRPGRLRLERGRIDWQDLGPRDLR
ncbi:hypothetical protein LCGC14_2926700, partial [marine sediment metagenome]